MDRRQAVADLTEFLVNSVEQARAVEKPFYHLQFDRVFPGRHLRGDAARDAGGARLPRAAGPQQRQHPRRRLATRVKIDLFPGYIRNLPAREARALGPGRPRALFERGARRLRAAARAGAGAPLRPDYREIGMFPIPILTRDVPQLSKSRRTPTPSGRASRSSSICRRTTPPSTSARSSTSKLPDGSMPKAIKMPFSPNTGYAFAVGSDTWHSADPVGPEVKTRDSILHTYFRRFRTAAHAPQPRRRVGNFIAQRSPRVGQDRLMDAGIGLNPIPRPRPCPRPCRCRAGRG